MKTKNSIDKTLDRENAKIEIASEDPRSEKELSDYGDMEFEKGFKLYQKENPGKTEDDYIREIIGLDLAMGPTLSRENLIKMLESEFPRVFRLYKNNLPKNVNLKNFNFSQLDYCVPSPGIPTKGLDAHPVISLLKKNRVKIISELDLFQIYLNSSINYLNGDIKIIKGWQNPYTFIGVCQLGRPSIVEHQFD